MDRTYIIDADVSPHYLLENVIRPSIYLPLDGFIYFELSNEELEALREKDNE